MMYHLQLPLDHHCQPNKDSEIFQIYNSEYKQQAMQLEIIKQEEMSFAGISKLTFTVTSIRLISLHSAQS